VTQLALLWRLAWRELAHLRRRQTVELLLVVFVLFIGFLGPFLSASIQTSVHLYLEQSSRKILSADLAVNSLRPFEKKELDWLKLAFPQSRMAKEIEFVTMARGAGVATLVEVKGVDSSFPIHGEFRLESSSFRSAESLNKSARIAWVYPEIISQLGLKVGDNIGIGNIEFRVSGVIKEAPGAGRTGGFAPVVYIGREFVYETGLTQYGAQVFHRVYLELSGRETSARASERIKNALRSADLSIRTPAEAIQGFERFFSFFNLYLVTVSMVVFVLSWTGAYYILQVYLQDRLSGAAVFMISGASRRKTALLYGLQVLLVVAVAFTAACLVGSLLTVNFARLFATSLPERFEIRFSLGDVLTLAGVAGLSVLVYTAPFCLRLFSFPLQRLLNETTTGVQRSLRGWSVLIQGFPPVIFLFVAVWLMDSWVAALRLVGGMFLVTGFGYLIGRLCFRGLYTLVRSTPGFVRLVATALVRSRFGVNLCFLALMLVALSANLVPHLLSSVIGVIEPLKGRELPEFFLFNIPESSLDRLRFYAKDREVELRHLSPLILGRLLKVNGVATEIDQFQRFPVRLSYRENLISSEQIIQGVPFSGTYDESRDPVAEISVEKRFAERNLLRVADEIEFEVQSLPIRARIVSIRNVQWTSFNPNFFITFQPGVLEAAPKTWIANVNFSGGEEKKVKIQFELNREFPDLTVVDIGRTITRVLEVARSVTGPARVAAWSAVSMSFLILLGVIAHNLRLREYELDLEKLFGANRALIRGLLVLEYGLLASFAWGVGAASALGISWMISRQVLDIGFRPSLVAVIISFFGVLLVTVAIVFVLATRVLARSGSSKRL
jgi:putative ABC transport system permease protein